MKGFRSPNTKVVDPAKHYNTPLKKWGERTYKGRAVRKVHSGIECATTQHDGGDERVADERHPYSEEDENPNFEIRLKVHPKVLKVLLRYVRFKCSKIQNKGSQRHSQKEQRKKQIN